MANILISLVSEQTEPNVLFIAERPDAERYVFISTEIMEQRSKTKDIVAAAHIAESSYQVLTVPFDDIEGCQKALSTIAINDDDKLILNITAGTKLMALAAYDFYSKRNAEIYYLTLGKNQIDRIFPFPLKKSSLNFRIGLQDYFTACGIEAKSNNSLVRTMAETRHFFQNVFHNQRDMIIEIQKLRNHEPVKKQLKKRKKISLDADQLTNYSEWKKIMEKLIAFLKNNGFTYHELIAKELDYIAGGWFEEHIYNAVKHALNLDERYLALNTRINKNGVNNELDVVFVHENKLTIIECKTGLKSSKGNILTETIYKQTALRNQFGLSVKTYLFTLESRLSHANKNRAKEMRLNILDGDTLDSAADLSIIIKDLIR